jgi:formate hydrogenlyase subunit 6/NADH:ubiquinone oxidoreductase subunit I
MHVITIADQESPARIEDKGCIRCYCCHEMCPHDAIELHSGILSRIFNRS